MRLVTHQRYADEIGPATYTANETTLTITTPPYVAAEKHFNDMLWPICASIIPMIREQKLHAFPNKAERQVCPFEYTYGMDIFEYLRQNQEMKEAFDLYMQMRREGSQAQWFDTYCAGTGLVSGELKNGKDDVLIVDVGGNKGHEIAKFREHFPDLPGRCIVQDLPETIPSTDDLPDGVEAMAHDFFTTQPIVGAKLYYFRAVMHNWSDTDCRKILRRTIDAMESEYSRILIDEFIMPETGADARQASVDVLMLLNVGGTERGLRQWEELIASVGLEIVRVWEPRGRRESVIECKVKDG